MNNLMITNTRFKQAKASRIWSLESPDRRTHNLTDYIIVNRKLMGGVRNSRAFPSADVGSDHQLIMMNVRLKLKAKKGTVQTRKISVKALKNEVIKRTFQTRIDQRWELMMTEKVEGIDEEWSKVKGISQETSEKTPGYKKSNERAEWISERTLKLMDERREYKNRRRKSADMAKQHNYFSRMVKKRLLKRIKKNS